MSDTSTNSAERLQQVLATLPERLQQPSAVLLQLLREVVEQAVAAVGSAVGSLLVPDAEGRGLRFLVAHDPSAAQLAALRVPIEGSIAGYVYSTGQMMAVGDLNEGNTSQYYADIDRQTGLATRTYLVLPVSHRDRIRGVATYVNRPGPQPYRPFQPEEMDLARTFAVLEGTLLQFLEGTRQLGRIASEELTDSLAAVSAQPISLPGPETAGESIEPWARVLQVLDRLSEDEQEMCADLVAFLEQRYFREK